MRFMVIACMIIVGCQAVNNKSPRDKFAITIGDVQLSSRLIKNSGSNEDSIEKPYIYFNVRIDKNQTRTLDKDKILYLNFDIQGDFSLKSGSVLMPPAICQKIENGRSGSYEYIVAFNADMASNSEVTLLYEDKIFGVGVVAFAYQEEDLRFENL